jgi:hypothetical protein
MPGCSSRDGAATSPSSQACRLRTEPATTSGSVSAGERKRAATRARPCTSWSLISRPPVDARHAVARFCTPSSPPWFRRPGGSGADPAGSVGQSPSRVCTSELNGSIGAKAQAAGRPQIRAFQGALCGARFPVAARKQVFWLSTRWRFHRQRSRATLVIGTPGPRRTARGRLLVSLSWRVRLRVRGRRLWCRWFLGSAA